MSGTDPATADDTKGEGELFALFRSLGYSLETVEHEAAHTVDQSRHLRGVIDGAHTKNLFLKDKKGTVFLVMAEEDQSVDLKRLHTVIGAKGRLSFGSAALMETLLGVAPGSVTVLGLINDTKGRVNLVVDRRLADAATVNVHPLRNTATTTLPQEAFRAFLAATGHTPLIVDLPAAEDQPAG
ncbi:MAG: prolyl-tRNA synthetase associated domain-containing protein [Pseudomonadota bacterium]